MKRKRRNHKPAFKAKVALAALKGDRTLSELSEQFDVHQNQIQDWRKRLLENSESARVRINVSVRVSEVEKIQYYGDSWSISSSFSMTCGDFIVTK